MTAGDDKRPKPPTPSDAMLADRNIPPTLRAGLAGQMDQWEREEIREIERAHEAMKGKPR